MMKETIEERMGRYLSGEGEKNEREAFEKELASNTDLNEQFLIFQKIWKNVPLDSNEPWDSALAWQKFISSSQPGLRAYAKTRKIKLVWAVAAALVIAVGVFIFFLNQGKPVAYAYIEDKREPVTLSDGSRVYLNKGATLNVYSINHKKRRVALNGEAFFEVSPDPKNPFIVQSGGTITEVVGTSFNITQTSENTRIFVNKGKVIFRSAEHKQAAVALTAGEAAEFKGSRMQMIPNPSPNINSWHSKQLNFTKNMSLAEIVADVATYFNQPISLENEALSRCHLSNTLSYADPEINEVLKPLASFVNASLKVEGNRYFIIGGQCP